MGAGGLGFTAVFSSNDQMALGLIHAFREAGLDVPGDVSVAGFDDIPESAHFWPPLTTVRQDFGQLGRRCVAMLVDAIHGVGPAVTPGTGNGAAGAGGSPGGAAADATAPSGTPVNTAADATAPGGAAGETPRVVVAPKLIIRDSVARI